MTNSSTSTKPKTGSPEREPWPALLWTLRPNDQLVAAVVTLVSLVFIVISWFYRGGHRGHLIDIDRASPQVVEFQVDINEADWPELSVLPEVGETLAKRIVETRKSQGPFTGIEDLRRVRGIGPRTLERIRPFIEPFPDLENTADQVRLEKNKS